MVNIYYLNRAKMDVVTDIWQGKSVWSISIILVTSFLYCVLKFS